MQTSKLIRVKDAPVVWDSLNGIINVFKPAGISVNNIRVSILGNLCKGSQFVDLLFSALLLSSLILIAVSFQV